MTVPTSPSDVPPGFGYPPRAPATRCIAPTSSFTPSSARPVRHGHLVRLQGCHADGRRVRAKEHRCPRRAAVRDAKRARRRNRRGGVWWDCYRDLVSNVVLVDKKTGLAPRAVELVVITPAVTLPAAAELPELAAVAARTFPLACPPSVHRENIAAFIDANLSEARFADYLADPDRVRADRPRGRPNCRLRHADSRRSRR